MMIASGFDQFTSYEPEGCTIGYWPRCSIVFTQAENSAHFPGNSPSATDGWVVDAIQALNRWAR